MMVSDLIVLTCETFVEFYFFPRKFLDKFGANLADASIDCPIFRRNASSESNCKALLGPAAVEDCVVRQELVRYTFILHPKEHV
jgi:hypothetical protein